MFGYLHGTTPIISSAFTGLSEWTTSPVTYPDACSCEPFVKNSLSTWGTSFTTNISWYDSTIPIRYSQFNISAVGMSVWDIGFPNRQQYEPELSVLGLGPHVDNVDGDHPGVLSKVKAEGSIGSMFFGLHVGSSSPGIPGSMLLGGYEQNRLLGAVGTFWLE
jgi:hypothetical protein